MSAKRKHKRLRAKLYDHRGEVLAVAPQNVIAPDVPSWKQAGDFRELKVWVCAGCFDGDIKFPLHDRDGYWVDQGIDFIADGMTTRAIHECSGKKYPLEHRVVMRATFPGGNWHEEVLRVPTSVWDRLTAPGSGIEAGPATIDPNHHR